jgi:hypothetical protein
MDFCSNATRSKPAMMPHAVPCKPRQKTLAPMATAATRSAIATTASIRMPRSSHTMLYPPCYLPVIVIPISENARHAPWLPESPMVWRKNLRGLPRWRLAATPPVARPPVVPWSAVHPIAFHLQLPSTAVLGPTLLNWRTRYGPVGAEDAAVALLGLEQRAARRAFVKVLAGVGRHGLDLRSAARRAGQGRLQDDVRGRSDHIGGSIQKVIAISATANTTEVRLTQPLTICHGVDATAHEPLDTARHCRQDRNATATRHRVAAIRSSRWYGAAR